MLTKLIELMEGFTLEEKGYWLIQNPMEEKVEIFWKRTENKSSWTLKVRPDRSIETNNEGLADALAAFGIEIERFEADLEKKVLSLTVYADMYMEKVRKVLGAEKIDLAISEHRLFSEKLIEAIRGALNERDNKPQHSKSPRPRLQVIQGKLGER